MNFSVNFGKFIYFLDFDQKIFAWCFKTAFCLSTRIILSEIKKLFRISSKKTFVRCPKFSLASLLVGLELGPLLSDARLLGLTTTLKKPGSRCVFTFTQNWQKSGEENLHTELNSHFLGWKIRSR